MCAGVAATAHQATDDAATQPAERAARASACRRLADAVYALALSDEHRLFDVIGADDGVKTAFDAVFAHATFGAPSWPGDGRCLISAQLPIERVLAALRSAPGADSWRPVIEKLAAGSDTRAAVRVTGIGDGRPDIVPGWPAAAASLIGAAFPLPTTLPTQPAAVPPIWRQVGPQARLLALEAARKDAQRQLAERIKRLRMGPDLRVRDLISESELLTLELNAEFIGAPEPAQYLHANDLLAEVLLVIPAEQAISAVRGLCSRHAEHRLRTADVEALARAAIRQDVAAYGVGAPPPQYFRRLAEWTGSRPPDWALQTLEVDGRGAPGADAATSDRVRAALAAERDARRALRERIYSLTITDGTPVRDLTARSESLEWLLESLVARADVTATRYSGAGTTVTVALPGIRVWSVTREALDQLAPRSGDEPHGESP
jgi:hypothetical protein